MKMNYHLKSSSLENRRKISQKKILAIIIIIIASFFFLRTNFVKEIIFSISTPVWKVREIFINTNIFQYFKAKQSLINEQIKLQQELSQKSNLIILNDILQNENETLKSLLGRRSGEFNLILGTILVKPPQTPYDLIIVDVGKKHGIKLGNKVVANGNVYIGEVSEIYADSSKITLYSNPGNKIGVILGESMISAEAIGLGGNNFNILLPREIVIKEGDIILVPGLENNILGIVEKINFKETDSFQTIFFKSPINISELIYVEIIL